MIPAKIHESLSTAWKLHPVAAVSGIVAFVGLLVSAWPLISWLSGHWQTSEEARQMEIRIHRETASLKVEAARQTNFTARNRVNDCNIRRARGPLTELEQGACAQYDDELRNSTVRFEEAQRAAQAAYRDK